MQIRKLQQTGMHRQYRVALDPGASVRDELLRFAETEDLAECEIHGSGKLSAVHIGGMQGVVSGNAAFDGEMVERRGSRTLHAHVTVDRGDGTRAEGDLLNAEAGEPLQIEIRQRRTHAEQERRADQARAERSGFGSKTNAYLIYLIAVALFGWALASYDFNVYVLTISDIAKTLRLPATEVGFVGFFLYAGEFIGSLIFGMMMDQRGRRFAWIVALTGATIFTGLTYVVQNFWELSTVRALADLFAYSELAISVTIVNEELPAKHRGFLYSIVQAGWPLGVVWAAIAYIGGIHWGWRILYLFDVPALFLVAILRMWIKEPRRWCHVHEVRQALKAGDEDKAKELRQEYDIDTSVIHKPSIFQLFSSTGENRRQFIVLSIVWFFYGCSYTATNAYIVYWLNKYHHFGLISIAEMLLASAGIGFGVYIFAGWLGERIPRVYMLMISGALVAPLSIGFVFVNQQFWAYFIYFFLYQVTNGFWSGVAYAYNAESFPTRFRGTATGLLDAVQIIGFLVGAGIWTALIGHSPRITWIIVAAGLSLGMYATFFLRRIPAGKELEAIAR